MKNLFNEEFRARNAAFRDGLSIETLEKLEAKERQQQLDILYCRVEDTREIISPKDFYNCRYSII